MGTCDFWGVGGSQQGCSAENQAEGDWMPCSQEPEVGWVPHGSTLQCMSLPICLPILEPKSHPLL